MTIRSWVTGLVAVGVVCGSTLYLGAAAEPPVSGELSIESISTRPDLVTAGDVLIQVRMPSGATLDQIAITVGGRDTTAAFKLAREPQTLLGLVKDLPVGTTTLAVGFKKQKAASQLAIDNHPVSGPIISGPHQTPFICQTEAAGFGPAVDADCSVATKVEYFYRSTTSASPEAHPTSGRRTAGNPFRPYPAQGPKPADLAMTTTLEGKTVPYIVRREMGTINRAMYTLAFLHEPGTPLPDPWTNDASWNRRLVYSFGSGCGVGYRQGTINALLGARAYLEDSQLQDYPLAKGYAIATSSLNSFGTSCNDVTSAETVMMVKEHFIERYGVPLHTIGTGGSGGSMQQHLIGNNYPGLLDGILPTRSFADTITFLQVLTDCELLSRAFDASAAQSGVSWTDEQKRAVAGHRTWSYCQENATDFALYRAETACDKLIPLEKRFQSATNRSGARCTYQDNMVNVFGRGPNGYARRTFDNVGVQYGLAALNSGAITLDQFTALNQAVGGIDVDGNPTPARAAADPEALRIAYRTGRLNQGGAGLAVIPIIDVRANMDAEADIHDAVPTRILRERLRVANGRTDNHVSITTASVGAGAPNMAPDAPFSVALRSAFDSMEAWLTALAAEEKSASVPVIEWVARSKPRNLVDGCYTTDKEFVTDLTRCGELFPYSSNARIVAGEPLTVDRMKCELRAVNRGDYQQPVSDAQLAALTSIFKQGVCDYSKKGVGQTRNSTWLSYGTDQ